MSNAGPATTVGPTDTGARYVDIIGMQWEAPAVCRARSRMCSIGRGLQ